MMKHDRFNEIHRRLCDDCYNAYLDFRDEQADEARLDVPQEDERADHE